MESLPLHKQFDFKKVKSLKCLCGTTVEYSMMTIMSFFDVDYIDCPKCNTPIPIDIEEFKIKENE